MKKFIPIQLTLLLILLHNTGFPRGVTKTGTTAAKILCIDTGARAVSMGGAFVSVADDASAMFWNPSGIAQLSQSEVIVSYSKWLADITYNYTGLVLPLKNFGALGINATFVTMDDMERTTIEEPEGTGEYFNAGSVVFGISYARALTDRFTIGFNGKFIKESIYNSSARGFAVDIGTMFRTQLNDMKIGMSISNFGTKMRMAGDDMLVQHDIDPITTGNNANINADLRTDYFDLPLLFRVGVSMDVLKDNTDNNFILAIDALYPNDNTEYLNMGCEYTFKELFYLRAGYKSLFQKDTQQGLTFGGGINIRRGRLANIYFNYAYQDFGLLNNVQKFTIGWRF